LSGRKREKGRARVQSEVYEFSGYSDRGTVWIRLWLWDGVLHDIVVEHHSIDWRIDGYVSCKGLAGSVNGCYETALDFAERILKSPEVVWEICRLITPDREEEL
jgi:hypothetical protein